MGANLICCNQDFGRADISMRRERITSYDNLRNIKQPFSGYFKLSDMILERESKILDHYEKESKIGQGAFGDVLLVKNKFTLLNYAMKTLKKKKDETIEPGFHDFLVSKLMKEIQILRTLDHPNILKIHEFVQDEENFYLITEYCNSGELFEMIKERKVVGEAMTKVIMKQLLAAVNYCHQHNIAHRDLKPENILLIGSDEEVIVKLIDFGEARVFNKGVKMTKITGTKFYVAPEVLSSDYTEKCDMWSLGVIMYLMIVGYPPFNGEDDRQIFHKIKIGKYRLHGKNWENVSEEAKDLISKLLTFNPSRRITAQKALQHPWFKINPVQSFLELDHGFSTDCLQNLRLFRAQEKLKNACFLYLANSICGDEYHLKLLRVFRELDKNGDGCLDRQELLKGYERIFGEITPEEVDDIIDAVDFNKTGVINFTEFLAAASNFHHLIKESHLRAAFNVFDLDGDGKIGWEELKRVLEKTSDMSDEGWIEIVSELDIDGDGFISFDEFKAVMNHDSIRITVLMESIVSGDSIIRPELVTKKKQLLISS